MRARVPAAKMPRACCSDHWRSGGRGAVKIRSIRTIHDSPWMTLTRHPSYLGRRRIGDWGESYAEAVLRAGNLRARLAHRARGSGCELRSDPVEFQERRSEKAGL